MGLLNLGLDSLGLQDSLGSKGLLGKIQEAYGGPDAFRGLMLTLGGHDEVGKSLMDNAGEAQKINAFLPKMMGALYGADSSDAKPPAIPVSPASLPQRGDAPDLSPYKNSIANIESGGKYDLLGPVTRSGDRAHGKYQVMGANVGPWSKEILGQEMTPEQFLADPKAQEAIFEGKFGQYVKKYGPEGASRAWFAGEGGMNNPNARDQLGTSVADYSRRFQSGLSQQPMRVASNAPIVPDNAPTDASAAARMPVPDAQTSPFPPMGAAVQTPSDETTPAPAAPTPDQLRYAQATPSQLPQIGATTQALPSLPGAPRAASPADASTTLAASPLGRDDQAQARIRKLEILRLAAPKTLQPFIEKRLEAEVKAAEPTKEKKDYLDTLKDPEYGKYLEASEKRKQQNVTVNAFANPLISGLSERFNKLGEQAGAAADDVRAIHAAREQIDRGLFAGTAGPIELGLAKIGTAFGIPNDKVANTEAFTAAIGQRVASLVKAFGSGNAISNADREFAAKMAGGDIKLDEASIRRILDIGERASRGLIDRYNGQAEKFGGALSEDAKPYAALMRIDAPAEYKPPEKPQPAAGQAAPQGQQPAAPPPVPGAERAPDGHWYVRQGGRIFRVDP